MYKLIGSPKTRGIRVLWMLEELGVGLDAAVIVEQFDQVFLFFVR